MQIIKTKTSTNQLPTHKSNPLVDAQAGHHCHLSPHCGKAWGMPGNAKAEAAHPAHLPVLQLQHISWAEKVFNSFFLSQQYQDFLDKNKAFSPNGCWAEHTVEASKAKLNTAVAGYIFPNCLKHWRETIFKHLVYILPLIGQVHWQANFMLKLWSVKSERTKSKRPALSTGCNQLKDTNSVVVSGFPPSARLSYHKDFVPTQQECWPAAPVLQLRVQLIL